MKPSVVAGVNCDVVGAITKSPVKKRKSDGKDLTTTSHLQPSNLTTNIGNWLYHP